MIVDDFNDYAALLGMNTSFTDAVPYQTGLTQETSRNAYEDSVISTTNQGKTARPGDRIMNQSMRHSITKETFKQGIKNQFRNTLKTSGQLRHILARQTNSPKARGGLLNHWNNSYPLAEESMTQHNDSVFQSVDMDP